MGQVRAAAPRRHATGSPAGAAVTTFAVALVVLCVLGSSLLRDGDTSWHIVTGRLVLDEGLPTVDTYSFTVAGERWIAKEWLSQVVLATAFRLGGWGGVVGLTATALAGALALVAAHVRRHLDHRAVVVAVGAAFVLAAPHMLARPHALALPVAVAFAAGLARVVDARRPDPPWPLLALVVLWANLHAGAILAPALAVGMGLEAVVRAPGARRRRVAARWGAFVLGTVVALVVTPYGPESLRAAIDVVTLGPALDVIGEWAPPDLSSPGPFEVVVLAAIGGALVAGVRLPWPRVLVLLGLLHLALAAVRNGDLLGLLAPVVLAAPVAASVPRLVPPIPTPSTSASVAAGRARPRGRTLVAVTLAVVVAPVVVAVTQPRPPAVLSPVAATTAVVDSGAEHLLHEYAWGGHLIAQGVPTFVDGRTELFGGPFVAAHAAALALDDVDALDDLLVAYDVDATMLRPTTPAVDLLDAAPAWRRVHTDELSVVHVREPDASPGLWSAGGPR